MFVFFIYIFGIGIVSVGVIHDGVSTTIHREVLQSATLWVVSVEGLSTVAILQVCTLLKLVIANLAHIINIEFEEIARIISRSTCLCRSTADESQFIHFEIIDKSIEQANRGVSLYILVNAIREKNPLSSILTFLYAISFLFITTNIHKIIENQEDTRLINYKEQKKNAQFSCLLP